LLTSSLLIGGLLSTPAHAYCRTAVCGKVSGQICVPSQATDCGRELYWAQDCIGFSVNEAASSHVDLATAESLMQQAFDAWTHAPCAHGTPSIKVSNLGSVSCDQKIYNQKGGNTNLVVFRDENWPYTTKGNTLALTTVTYNLDSGAIFDADLEVNGTINLTIGDNQIDYDLLSILTHEAGHMLGIAHSKTTAATMYIQYVPGGTGLRTLDQDDVDAICAAYPPGEENGTCDPTPRHGFADVCSPPADEEPEGCTCATGPTPESPQWWLWLLTAAAVWRLPRASERCIVPS